MTRTALCAIVPAALACGCVHLPSHCSRTQTPIAPASLTQPFAPAFTNFPSVREAEWKSHIGYRRRLVEFSISSTPSSDATNGHASSSLLQLELFAPTKGPGPVVLLLPMGGGGYAIERHFARYFARRGFAAVIAYRRNMAPQSNLEEIDSWFQDAVRDNRIALDWIETCPDFDASRIALFGISTGGIRGVMLFAIDQRIKAAVLGLAGGDLPYILRHSTERSIARRRNAWIRDHASTPDAFESTLQQTLRCEPNVFAQYIDCRRTLLVLAKRDTVVPFRKGLELRKNLGEPETLLLPTGHYTAALAIPKIGRESVRFFRKKLFPQRAEQGS